MRDEIIVRIQLKNYIAKLFKKRWISYS